jgi:hypothetical protein
MKTLKLNRAESAAYAAGERRFWRQWRVSMSHAINHPQVDPRQLLRLCRYGKVGDRIELIYNRHLDVDTCTITAITVEQRDGRWGWVVEVGA